MMRWFVLILLIPVYFFFFFFSSRRRHTRSLCDWSSDVCSSDLVVTSMKEAFTRHLYDGGPVDVPHHALTVAAALELGRAAGAAMSLAHPHVYDHLAFTLLRRHRNDGLEAIEAFYGSYDPRERGRWLELANELDL